MISISLILEEFEFHAKDFSLILIKFKFDQFILKLFLTQRFDHVLKFLFNLIFTQQNFQLVFLCHQVFL